MSDNTNGMNNATEGLGDHDANGDNGANTDNGINTPQNASSPNDSPVRRETHRRTLMPIHHDFRQVDKDARCLDCGRFSIDTMLLQVTRPIVELFALTEGMENIAERCPTCLRLWVSYDHQERDLQGDNDPEMVCIELEFFADFQQLLSGPAAANPSPDDVDEDIYGTSGSDADDEADSERSSGDSESDSE